MNWIDVAKMIAPIAPAAGSILGGFIPIPGGSFIGEQFGKAIARSFGVPETPSAVAGAVASNPNEVVLAKIAQATELARIETQGFVEAERITMAALAESSARVNETMRLEATDQRHWFFTGWRPACGWIFDVYAVAFGALLMVATAMAVWKSGDPLKTINDAWQIYAAFFGVLAAMVGVLIVGRSQEKTKAIEVGAVSPVVVAAKPGVKR